MNLSAEPQENLEASKAQSIDGLGDPVATVFSGFAQGIKPPPPIDFVAWAEANIRFGSDSPRRGPYRQDKFPYFRKILECLQPNHPARIVVLRGSAQLGKTIVANVFVGGCMDLDPGPFLYCHPTIENADKWVQEKWKPFVTQSDALSTIFPWESRSRHAANKARVKERADGRGTLRISGANSASSLAQASYPRQVQDDLSKWENNEHGDPESQADKRSQAFEYAKILKISTPGIVGKCRISHDYEKSNQQKYHLPCPHCGHRHALEWENFKQSLDDLEAWAKAHPNDGIPFSQAHFSCPSCGGVIEHHHKESMLDATLEYDAWVAERPSVEIQGFDIWSAYSRLITWERIAQDYFLAKGNPEKEQNFINDTAGLPWEQKGEAPPWQELHKRAQASNYDTGTIPHGAVMLTIGADVQGDRVEWTLYGWGSGLRRWAIQHAIIEGHISETRVREQLDGLLKRKWKNMAGRALTIDGLAIDANYETNDVKDWAKKHSETRVITIKGAKEYTAPPMALVRDERNAKGKVRRRQCRHWLVGVSGMKGFLYKNLEKVDPLERGYCGFARDFDEEFFKQLCSERRITDRDKSGQAVMRWERLPQVRNEILDTAIYAEAMARRLSWHAMSDEVWERLRAEREAPAPEQQLDLLDPVRAFSGPSPAVTKQDTGSLAAQLA